MNNFIGLIIAFGYIFAIIGIAEGLRRWRGYGTGFTIEGLDDVDQDILIFHAGTRANGSQIVTDGGRVLTIAGTGKTIAEARSKVYGNAPRIRFDGCHYRRDIAAREVRR